MRPTPIPPTPEQIRAWQQEAAVRYPDFVLVLQVQDTQVGWRYSLHFRPQKTVKVLPRAGFPLKAHWYPLEMWYQQDGNTQLDFIYSLYPDQSTLVRAGRTLPVARLSLLTSTAGLGASLVAAPQWLQAGVLLFGIGGWGLSRLKMRAQDSKATGRVSWR